MNRKFPLATMTAAAAAAMLSGLVPTAAWAQLVIKDDFTGATTQNAWKWFNGACLTAGDGTNNVPSCIGIKSTYYKETLVGGATGTLPDTAGNGALRFTNGSPGGLNQNGAIVSTLNPSFKTTQGIQATFTTITYRGNSGGGGGDGADGISFFLMDASKPAGIGAFGGSLGYSCSNANPPYNGLVGGYIAVGVDEYGNFLNGGPNRSTTFPNNGPDNTASGWGYQPGRIGLRGAGNIAWSWLNSTQSGLYPSSLTSSQQQSAVRNTCSTGYLWDYSSPGNPKQTTTPVMDYPAIPGAYDVLSGVQIANESATKRSDGTPITYKLKITSAGLLSFSYSLNGAAYQPVITDQDITASNGKLPDGLQFGFAGSTGGSTNIHEIMCFQASPADQSASSAGLNQQQATKVQIGTQVYFAFYNPSTWAGSLTAHDLIIDTSNKLTIKAAANWDASCVLTGLAAGPTCPTTGAANNTAQGPTQRKILSWDGTKGIPFQWTSLSPAQQTALTAGDATSTTNRLNYLRGDRTKEFTASGSGMYRARASVLGDILDSSPTWVGTPSGPYAATWADSLYPAATPAENAGPTYPAYITSAQTRLNVVYTGANDGLLHGFRAGFYSDPKTYVANDPTKPNDGLEVLAYMPGAVVQTIHNSTNAKLDFSDARYAHNFFVDGSPGTGDLYYNGAWHTWLVGGLGPGGAAIYALDVTDPTKFSEGNASSLVIGEWATTTTTSAGVTTTTSTLNCVTPANCGKNLGNTYGVPQIRRFHNGRWGAIFGNGFGSSTGDAGIYVMVVDNTGAPTFYYLSTGKSGGNGIAYATPADLDGDHVTDYVYAGDLLGNVWRFDLTSDTPANWVTAGATKVYTPSSTGLPITTKVIVASVPSATSAPRIMVEFGTGQQTPLSYTSPASYASKAQSLYGIWDWNTSAWNTKSSIKYASATGLVSGSTLLSQTITDLGGGYRSVTSKPVCWQDSTACTSTPQYGWTVPLPGTSTTTSASGTPTQTINHEQVIYSPILAIGAFIVNTTIPATNSPLTCTASTPTGWTLALSPANGGAFPTSFFSDSAGNFVTQNGNVVSGIAWNGTGTPSIVIEGPTDPTEGPTVSGTYIVTQTVDGNGAVGRVNPPAGTKGGRLTWIERR